MDKNFKRHEAYTDREFNIDIPDKPSVSEYTFGGSNFDSFLSKQASGRIPIKKVADMACFDVMAGDNSLLIHKATRD